MLQFKNQSPEVKVPMEAKKKNDALFLGQSATFAEIF